MPYTEFNVQQIAPNHDTEDFRVRVHWDWDPGDWTVGAHPGADVDEVEVLAYATCPWETGVLTEQDPAAGQQRFDELWETDDVFRGQVLRAVNYDATQNDE